MKIVSSKASQWILFSALIVSAVVLAGFRTFRLTGAPVPAPADQSIPEDLKGFAALEPVDLHTHVYKSDPDFLEFMNRLHLHIVNILVVYHEYAYAKELEPQRTDALSVVRNSHGHAVLCTTFDPFKLEEPGFAEAAIQQLNHDFDAGAVAVKIHREIGMELRRRDGTYVMPDDSAFQPIYRDIAARHKTLIAHLAEPDSCWLPLDPNSPDYSYYSIHPEGHMFLHPDHPAKAPIMAARDHILAQNPDLRVIGAHLGSMESSLDDIAAHLDRYPNFAVEIGGRAPYFALQPRDKVKNFLLKYQDRVLYGTDLQLLITDTFQESTKQWTDMYTREWKYFSTDQTVDLEGHTAQGVKLPHAVLVKLYHQNAVRWLTGTGW